MANVFLTDEAYAKLKAAKEDSQSFSDWVMENAKPEINWDKYLGCCKDMDVDKALAELKRERRR